MSNRVVVTGMGAVTPIGNSVSEFWTSLKNGVGGIGPITRFDTTDYKCKIAGEITASEPSGRTKSEQIVVFMVSPVAALPFSLLYPMDGIEVKEPSILVVGVTSPDVIVGVNGILVEVNARGVFSTTVPLEEGDNLIEVVATDIREVRFQTIVVFHTP